MTILFAFWGRRANVELQLPFIHRILNQNPDVRFEGWNLARTDTDNDYLRRLGDDFADAERFSIRSDHVDDGFNAVWRHYAANPFRRETFVKLDDDVVFIETDRFGEFVAAIDDDSVLSASVVNNGACTARVGLGRSFAVLDIDLLDVHESNEYAVRCHQHMHTNWRTIIRRPGDVAETADWLSINLIGYSWAIGRLIASRLGTRSQRVIAGRDCRRWRRLGDEGAANLLPRRIHPMLAAHLGFGPQNVTDAQAHAWRNAYTRIRDDYLGSAT